MVVPGHVIFQLIKQNCSLWTIFQIWGTVFVSDPIPSTAPTHTFWDTNFARVSTLKAGELSICFAPVIGFCIKKKKINLKKKKEEEEERFIKGKKDRKSEVVCPFECFALLEPTHLTGQVTLTITALCFDLHMVWICVTAKQAINLSNVNCWSISSLYFFKNWAYHW